MVRLAFQCDEHLRCFSTRSVHVSGQERFSRTPPSPAVAKAFSTQSPGRPNKAEAQDIRTTLRRPQTPT